MGIGMTEGDQAGRQSTKRRAEKERGRSGLSSQGCAGELDVRSKSRAQHALSHSQQQALALHWPVLACPGPIGTERFLSVWRLLASGDGGLG